MIFCLGVTVSISRLQEPYDVVTVRNQKDDVMISSCNSSTGSHGDDNGEDGPDPTIKSEKGVSLPNVCVAAMVFTDN